jgi:hypothetical protein
LKWLVSQIWQTCQNLELLPSIKLVFLIGGSVCLCDHSGITTITHHTNPPQPNLQHIKAHNTILTNKLHHKTTQAVHPPTTKEKKSLFEQLQIIIISIIIKQIP